MCVCATRPSELKQDEGEEERKGKKASYKIQNIIGDFK